MARHTNIDHVIVVCVIKKERVDNMNETHTYVVGDSEAELARLQIQGSSLDESLPLLPHLFQVDQHPHARILDLGCGPATWTIQVARSYPACEVVGVDINPRMTAYAISQADAQKLDVQFQVQDILQPLNFPDESFDLVNLRLGVGYIPIAKAPTVFQECWRVLKPNGVLRNIESVQISSPYVVYQQTMQWIAQAFYAAGLTYNAFEMSLSAGTARIFQGIGFQPVEIVPHLLDISVGMPLYQPMLDNSRAALILLKPFLTKQLHLSTDEIEKVSQQAAQEWTDPAFSAHWYLCSVVGMKQGAKE